MIAIVVGVDAVGMRDSTTVAEAGALVAVAATDTVGAGVGDDAGIDVATLHCRLEGHANGGL